MKNYNFFTFFALILGNVIFASTPALATEHAQRSKKPTLGLEQDAPIKFSELECIRQTVHQSLRSCLARQAVGKSKSEMIKRLPQCIHKNVAEKIPSIAESCKN